MAEVIKQIMSAGGGDYTTLNAWEADRRGNIVTRDTIEIAEVYGGGSVGGLSLLNENWITDSTHYAQVRAAAGAHHRGVPDASKAYMRVADLHGIHCTEGFTRIGPGIFLDFDPSIAGVYAAIRLNGADSGRNAPIVIDEMFVVSRASPRSASAVVLAQQLGANSVTIKNSVIINNNLSLNTNTCVNAYQSGTVRVYNSVLVQKNSTLPVHTNVCLFSLDGSTLISENNYLFSATECYRSIGTGFSKGAHDATNNGEAITPALRNVPFTTDTFIAVAAGAEDLHIQRTSTLNAAGVTIAAVEVDIDGAERVDPPSIGIDEPAIIYAKTVTDAVRGSDSPRLRWMLPVAVEEEIEASDVAIDPASGRVEVTAVASRPGATAASVRRAQATAVASRPYAGGDTCGAG